MKAFNTNFLQFRDKKENYTYLPPLPITKKFTKKDEFCACPLCKRKEYVVVGKFEINHLIEMWIEKWKFNPIPDVYQNEILEKRYCENCGLFYYNFHLSDFEELYQNLNKDAHYYPQFRPEYGMATEIIEKLKPQSLLEIGCGCGAFLERISHLVPQTVGSEYNSEEADFCRRKGLEVFTEDISKITETFDVICHFEVLEHVFETKAFITETLNHLKVGGKLIIGTPDPESILAINGKKELNLPPHHQFDFSKKCFDWLAEDQNLKIIDYQKSQLDYQHYCRYVFFTTGIELTQPDMTGYYEAQKKYSGHSHLVVFEKL